MKILIINAGSSSIKFRLVNQQNLSLVANGILDRIGTKKSQLSYCLYKDHVIIDNAEQATLINNATEGFKVLLDLLQNRIFLNQPMELAAIGHRVVHGGEHFMQSVLISESVIEVIRENIPLAPEHNPANLKGIEIFRKAFPATPQVAVFDTAFHQTMPAKAYRYPLAEALYIEHKIRRYGFHGTSHHTVAHCAAQAFDTPISQLNFITLHLGNGASATAIQGGRSIDTSMGMTPLEGLMMGTRSGNIDPGIIFYLARNTKLDLDEIETLLNKQSGLSGICGSNDMREIQRRADQGDKQAILAIEMYCYRIKKYIGAYFAILGRLDGLVFTAGVGENSAAVRLQVCQGLESLGVCIDPEKNSAVIKTATEIQVKASSVKIFVIPTDEEIEIARQTRICIESKRD
jgi:acetate kinase